MTRAERLLQKLRQDRHGDVEPAARLVQLAQCVEWLLEREVERDVRKGDG